MNELPKEILSNGTHCSLIGDYYFPDFADPDEHGSFGKWADLHHTFLKEHQTGTYLELLMSDRLIAYLEQFNEQAEERYQRIIEQMKQAEGVTEELKAQNQMEWVHRMNLFSSIAKDIILKEMICR